MKKWSRQQIDVAQVANSTAQVNVKHFSGPIAVAGSYLFSTRLSGITLLSGATRAATRAKFPKLGPRGAAEADRLRFYTPFDLMVFGYNPILPVPAEKGALWRSAREGRDWRLFGVTGVSRVIGTNRRVRTPAGLFRTTVVRSRLTQRGYRFGSGTRTTLVRGGQGAREARLPPPRRQQVDRRAYELTRCALSSSRSRCRSRSPLRRPRHARRRRRRPR